MLRQSGGPYLSSVMECFFDHDAPDVQRLLRSLVVQVFGSEERYIYMYLWMWVYMRSRWTFENFVVVRNFDDPCSEYKLLVGVNAMIVGCGSAERPISNFLSSDSTWDANRDKIFGVSVMARQVEAKAVSAR